MGLESRPELLEGGTLHLWVFTFAELVPRYPALAAVLSEQERMRVERFRSSDDRERAVLSRGQLRELLEGYTGIPAHGVKLASGPHGRPSVRSAAGRPDVRFNVAHSDSVVAFVFALGLDVGVDLEPLVAPDDPLGRQEVYRRLLSPAEARRLEEAPTDARARLVLRSWVRKEACLKALGTGLAEPPDRVDVSEAVASITGVPTLTTQPGRLWVEDFSATGHVGAVAMLSPVAPAVTSFDLATQSPK